MAVAEEMITAYLMCRMILQNLRFKNESDLVDEWKIFVVLRMKKCSLYPSGSATPNLFRLRFLCDSISFGGPPWPHHVVLHSLAQDIR